MPTLQLRNSKQLTELLDEAKDRPVLVSFGAPDWCKPCQFMEPILEEFSGFSDQYVVGKVDIDQAYDLAEEFNIKSVPTFVVFKNGVETERQSGAMPKKDLVRLILKAA